MVKGWRLVAADGTHQLEWPLSTHFGHSKAAKKLTATSLGLRGGRFSGIIEACHFESSSAA